MTINIPGAHPPTHHSLAGRARRGRVTAALVSLGLHLLALAALFGSASGKLLATDAGDQDRGQMTVSVIAASSLRPAATPTATQGLEPLLARYGSAQPPVYLAAAPTSSGLTQWLARLGSAAPANPMDAKVDSAARVSATFSARPGEQALRETSEARHGRDKTSDTAGSTGGLWGAIQPCWNRLASASTVPVTLEASLDGRGRLATPPRIVRDNGGVSEARLRAEANALAALSACLPQGDLRVASQVYRLEFPPHP
jgi:hypothetical protein